MGELAVWVAVLVVLVAVSVYLVSRFRDETIQQEPKAGQLLSKLREQRSRGELSGEEFREIETTLAAQLKEELKDNGGTG